MSHYRCCCGDGPGACCQLWCNCPDELTVSLCTKWCNITMRACGMSTLSVCPIPDGTIVGSQTRSVTVTGVLFRKVSPAFGCPGCCEYEVVQGEDQTGTITANADMFYVNCYEQDNDECKIANLECEGAMSGPLSGNFGSSWILTSLAGALRVSCCNSQCQDNAFKASLTLDVIAAKLNSAETTDCCTQDTTLSAMTVERFFAYEWDCRHESRWRATCPKDLMDEPGQVVQDTIIVSACKSPLMGGGADCLVGTGTTCPCNPFGQGADYPPDCLGGFVQPVITYCIEWDNGYICPPNVQGPLVISHA